MIKRIRQNLALPVHPSRLDSLHILLSLVSITSYLLNSSIFTSLHKVNRDLHWLYYLPSVYLVPSSHIF